MLSVYCLQVIRIGQRAPVHTCVVYTQHWSRIRANYNIKKAQFHLHAVFLFFIYLLANTHFHKNI